MHNQSNVLSYDKESTMKAEPSRSANATVARLKRRYPDIDFKASIRELCEYLKSKCTPQQIKARGGNELTDPYVVAMRCMYPTHGAIGLLDYNLEVVSFFWMMVNDPNPMLADNVGQYALVDFMKYGVTKMTGGLFFSAKSYAGKAQENPVPVEVKLEQFVQILRECQRERNVVPNTKIEKDGRVVTGFMDDGKPCDQLACIRGVINNLCSGFADFDQDVSVDQDVSTQLYDLIKGFVADYLIMTNKANIQSLSVPGLDLCSLVPAYVRADIKAKVIRAFGGRYEDPSDLGLITEEKEVLLDLFLQDETFAALLFEDDNGGSKQEQIQRLMNNAKEKLRRAEAATTSFLAYNFVADRFDAQVEEIKAMIISILPVPAFAAQQNENLEPNESPVATLTM